MEVFKIRNNKTGLYSSGSSRPTFTDKGKTWMTRRGPPSWAKVKWQGAQND